MTTMHATNRLTAVALAAAALMPPPAEAQDPGDATNCVPPWHGTTPDRNLAVLERAAENDDRVEFRYATEQAKALLTQYSGCRRSPDDFGPRSRAELDAFADRLVDFAIANAGNEYIVFEIRLILGVAARPGESEGYVPYAGAFDALKRMYEGGVGDLHDLMATDLERAMAYGAGRLASGMMMRGDVCWFLRLVGQLGELVLFDDGSLEVELVESADYNADIPPVPPDYNGRARGLANELVDEGVIEANCGGHRGLSILTVDGVEVQPAGWTPRYLKRRRR